LSLENDFAVLTESSSQPRWRTGSAWLLDCCDEEAGREEQSSPIFDLQWCVSSVVLGYMFTLFHFHPDDT